MVLLCLWLTRSQRRLTALSLGAIIGGAIGNVVDRARFGAVYDFVDLHYAGWHWPAFDSGQFGHHFGGRGAAG